MCLIQGAAPLALRHVNGEPISYVASAMVTVYCKSLASRMDQSEGWQNTYTQGVLHYPTCQVIRFAARFLEILKSCVDKNSVLPYHGTV
jgi:hypothetical protein